jgi:hypothetical protein
MALTRHIRNAPGPPRLAPVLPTTVGPEVIHRLVRGEGAVAVGSHDSRTGAVRTTTAQVRDRCGADGSRLHALQT